MVAINLHLLWLMSNTTKRPTESEFFQLFRTSAKFFQFAPFVILYQCLGIAACKERLVEPYSAPRLGGDELINFGGDLLELGHKRETFASE